MNSSATMEATRSKRACATTKTRGAPGRGTAGTTGPNGSAIMVPSLLPGSLSWEVNRVAPTARPAAPRVSGRARFDVLGCSKPISGRQLAAGLTPAPGSRPDQPLCPSWPAGARPVAWGGRPALVAPLPVDLGEIPAPEAADAGVGRRGGKQPGRTSARGRVQLVGERRAGARTFVRQPHVHVGGR